MIVAFILVGLCRQVLLAWEVGPIALSLASGLVGG
jgi:hypothetical protein